MPALDPSKTIRPPTAADIKAAARASMSLPVADFADAAVAAGLITEAEGRAWVMRNQLPAVAMAAINAQPNARAKRLAEYRMLAAVNVARTNPLVAVLAQTMNLAPDAVDALFQPPSL